MIDVNAPLKLNPANQTTAQIQAMLEPLIASAFEAGQNHAKDMPDEGACGFAWVVFKRFTHPDCEGGQYYSLHRNTKFGKALENCQHISLDHFGRHQIWGGTMYSGQSIDAVEAAAKECALVLGLYGFETYVNSRLD